MEGLAAEHFDYQAIMIDATYLKAHRTTSSLWLKKGRTDAYWRTKGEMNTKLHAATEANGRPKASS